jgi:protein SCO1
MSLEMGEDMDYWVLKIAKMYRILFLIMGSFLLSNCNKKQVDDFRLPYYNNPDFTPIFIKNKEVVNSKITHQINDFSFLNQDSVFISNKNIEGKIHVANFIFTTCGSICPNMTHNLKTVSDSLQNDKQIVFLSYSVTPWIDKPSILQQYKIQNRIKNPNWHFLTGSKNDIYSLARKSYFVEEDFGFSKDSSQFLHTEHFILVDKSKRIRGIYNGTLVLEMQQLLEDIKVLKKEN